MGILPPLRDPDTPTVSTSISSSTGTDYRVVSSRFRIAGTGQKGINSINTNTAAAKLLQSSGMMSKSFDAAQLPPNLHASNSIGNVVPQETKTIHILLLQTLLRTALPLLIARRM